MRRFLLLPAILLATMLAGCVTLDPGEKSILQGGTSLTAPIDNPVTAKSPYQARLTLNLGLKAANKWADYCWSKPYAQITADPVAGPICKNRRSVRRTLAAAGDKADKAIKKASDFIRANPTISAAGLVNDMWAAVNDYRSKIPALQ